ncbi:MAG: CBS domain-containing protein [Chloroflexi bacterium]|nr:CBS domain-containing protein [Chloroflexota bacterium]
MLVKDIMTRHPILVAPETPVTEVQSIMVENQVRHLPVAGDGKRLQGLITRQRLALSADELGSLNVWEITRHISQLTAKQIMLKKAQVITIDPDRTVERAAALITDHKISGLPVIENGIIVGILTETDLLRAFQIMLGLPMAGVRVTVRMPNRKGEFNKLSTVLAQKGWGVAGMGSFPTPRHSGQYDLVLKISDVSVEEVKEALSDIPDQTIVDIRTVV